jgi:hypothetical protein
VPAGSAVWVPSGRGLPAGWAVWVPSGRAADTIGFEFGPAACGVADSTVDVAGSAAAAAVNPARGRRARILATHPDRASSPGGGGLSWAMTAPPVRARTPGQANKTSFAW